MKKFIFILILFISMFLIENCSTLRYEIIDDADEQSKLQNVEELDVDFIEIVLTSEDDSLNSIKESITDYVLQKLSQVEKMKLINNLLLYKKDASSLVYNLESANTQSANLLVDEFPEEEEDTDDSDNETESSDKKGGKEGDSDVKTEPDEEEQEEVEEEVEDEKVIEDIVSDIPEFVLIPLKDSEQESIINESILGKDPATIENEKFSTYTLNMPEDVSQSIELLPEDFNNTTKIISKLFNSEKDIIICSLIEIKSKIITIKVKVINNILHQILGEFEFKVNKMDYQRGDVFIEPPVWNKLKLIFLGEDIASFKVNTNIDNVLVYIDDKYVGRTRKEKKDIFSLSVDVIESGSHRLKLIKNNYKNIEGYIYLEKGQNSFINIDMELLKSQSSVLLYISEPNADVWFNMTYIGSTSEESLSDKKDDNPYLFIIDGVQEGIHKVRVEKAGFNPFVEKVSIDGINDKLVKVSLQDYNDKLFDPDYRSAPFKVTFDILLYSSLLSLTGTIVSFFEFNTFEDELYSIGGLYGGIDNLRYEDIKNNYRNAETWKNIFSATTILFILGSITFKWIELDKRNIQIGQGHSNSNILFEPIILFDNDKKENLQLGFSFGYSF